MFWIFIVPSLRLEWLTEPTNLRVEIDGSVPIPRVCLQVQSRREESIIILMESAPFVCARSTTTSTAKFTGSVFNSVAVGLYTYSYDGRTRIAVYGVSKAPGHLSDLTQQPAFLLNLKSRAAKVPIEVQRQSYDVPATPVVVLRCCLDRSRLLSHSNSLLRLK